MRAGPARTTRNAASDVHDATLAKDENGSGGQIEGRKYGDWSSRQAYPNTIESWEVDTDDES